MLRVQRAICATCIYRPDSALDAKVLEQQVADPRMPGHFAKFRICHHSTDACCRGFWDRHKDKFDIGQIAQRLKLVTFVLDDVLKIRSRRPVRRRLRHQPGTQEKL